jgi:hypothetical protein
MGHVSVVSGLFVISCPMVLGSFPMVLGRMLMMLGRFRVVFHCFLGHDGTP